MEIRLEPDVAARVDELVAQGADATPAALVNQALESGSLWSAGVGNYVIFFRGRNPVEILRIVNGAVDFDRLTFTD